MGGVHADRAATSDIEHDHVERPHQGLGNQVIKANREPGTGPVASTERLGGILKSYRHAA
ncbi:MAG: hypothetical protein DRQ55_09470 [Planctomycetota bacterium]|nr:MAG: hypothetical protein DRQ55_09470 [Planctomycetota bacterium]